MAKIPIWKTIAERITKDIAKGHYQPGTKLPTESKLAERFVVNRHTVRHAISALVDEGLVYTRRGSGAFVAIKPLRYSIGLIDETPVSHFLAVFPAARFPNMLNTLSKHRSFTKSFAAAGVLDYTRAETRITAVVSNATTANHLNLRPGSVLLRSISINVDMDGKAIEFGRTWFSGDHIEMIVEH
jgi:GntR family phosphonate transport system transcriptional regulator